MFAGLVSTQFVTTERDFAVVRAKTAADLAESLEIMMVETRPKGPEFVQLRGLHFDARQALRGAVALLLDQPTNTSYEDAVRVVDALRGLWVKQRLPARELICLRILEVLRDKHADS